jgi:hypothetical protein
VRGAGSPRFEEQAVLFTAPLCIVLDGFGEVFVEGHGLLLRRLRFRLPGAQHRIVCSGVRTDRAARGGWNCLAIGLEQRLGSALAWWWNSGRLLARAAEG